LSDLGFGCFPHESYCRYLGWSWSMYLSNQKSMLYPFRLTGHKCLADRMGGIQIDWLYVTLAAFCELGRQTGDVVSYVLYRSGLAGRKTQTATVKQRDHVTMAEILCS